jgi:DNA-binding CsgD family transcriptional regulator
VSTPTDDQLLDPLPVHGRKWRTAPHVQERLRTVADLRRRGLGQAEIAAQVGVSPATVSRDLARLDLLAGHEHTEFLYSQRLEILLPLRELTLVCLEVISHYRHDPDRLADLAAVASVIVAAQREVGHLLAGDPDAGGLDAGGLDAGGLDDEEVQEDIIDGRCLLDSLLATQNPDYGEGKIADLRRRVDAEIGRYIGPERVAVIQRGLALAQRHDRDASPGDDAPAE